LGDPIRIVDNGEKLTPIITDADYQLGRTPEWEAHQKQLLEDYRNNPLTGPFIAIAEGIVGVGKHVYISAGKLSEGNYRDFFLEQAAFQQGAQAATISRIESMSAWMILAGSRDPALGALFLRHLDERCPQDF
jgi:hypothetical protein